MTTSRCVQLDCIAIRRTAGIAVTHHPEAASCSFDVHQYPGEASAIYVARIETCCGVMHEDHPRLLLILSLSDLGVSGHARSASALSALGFSEMRQGVYELSQAMTQSNALRDFSAQFGLEGGIAWLMAERTQSELPDGNYRPMVDRTERHAATLVAWRRDGGSLPSLEQGEMVRLS